jgi:hypothetical protein
LHKSRATISKRVQPESISPSSLLSRCTACSFTALLCFLAQPTYGTPSPPTNSDSTCGCRCVAGAGR